MESTLICPVKINITLRIMESREDGYHELFSAFWKKNGAERLTIRSVSDENMADKLTVHGAVIEGENILSKALASARSCKPCIPAMEMVLEKHYPQGSGIGAGSGDAAALVRFLNYRYGAFKEQADIASLGADVAFLAGGSEVAFARGVGEKLAPQKDIGGLFWILAFPSWQSHTGAAYAALDQRRAAACEAVMSDADCEKEALEITGKLRRGEQVGLLPNDFTQVLLDVHGEYSEAFDAASQHALAWGLCGSGSALFAVCGDKTAAEKTQKTFEKFNWIIKISILE